MHIHAHSDTKTLSHTHTLMYTFTFMYNHSQLHTNVQLHAQILTTSVSASLESTVVSSVWLLQEYWYPQPPLQGCR